METKLIKSVESDDITLFSDTDSFLSAVRDGRLRCVAQGSERGYVAKCYYPGCYRGVVRRGFRAGLHKFQLSGKGGPHFNSSIYTTNLYYKEV